MKKISIVILIALNLNTFSQEKIADSTKVDGWQKSGKTSFLINQTAFSNWVSGGENSVAATGGIFLLYLISFVMSFFGSGISLLSPNNSSMLSIGLSFGIVIIAALNLVIDFDFIEEGSEKGAPKYMEWYGAFGLLVTLIWLYLELLRLLAKMKNR